MASQFARRRGYALTPLLPGLFEEFAFPGALDARLKHDFDRTLDDLLIEEHLEPIRRWANRKGLRSRAQAYQAGLGQLGTTENSRLAAAAQQPDVESLGFGDPTVGEARPGARSARPTSAPCSNRYRQVVSGAHLSGRAWSPTSGERCSTGSSGSAWRTCAGSPTVRSPPGVTHMALHGFAYRLYDRSARRHGPAAVLAGMVRVLRPCAPVLGRLEPALAAAEVPARAVGLSRTRRRRAARRPPALDSRC